MLNKCIMSNMLSYEYLAEGVLFYSLHFWINRVLPIAFLFYPPSSPTFPADFHSNRTKQCLRHMAYETQCLPAWTKSHKPRYQWDTASRPWCRTQPSTSMGKTIKPQMAGLKAADPTFFVHSQTLQTLPSLVEEALVVSSLPFSHLFACGLDFSDSSLSC